MTKTRPDEPLDYLNFYVRPIADYPEEMTNIEIVAKLVNKNTIPIRSGVDMGITATLSYNDGVEVFDVRYESMTDTYTPLLEEDESAPIILIRDPEERSE